MANKKLTTAKLENNLSYVLRDQELYPEETGNQLPDTGNQVAGVGLGARFLADILAKAKPETRTKDILEEIYSSSAPKMTTEELRKIMDEISPGEDVPTSTAIPDSVDMNPPVDDPTTTAQDMANENQSSVVSETPTGQVVEDAVPPPIDEGAVEQAKMDEAESLLEDYRNEPVPDQIADKRTEERRINIQRASEGGIANTALDDMPPDEALALMENTDDINRYLNVVGRQQPKLERRGFEEIEATTESPENIRGTLEKLYNGNEKTIGNLNEVQMYGLRRTLAQLAGESVELANKIAAGNNEIDVLMAWQRKSEAFNSLYAFVQGRVTESARILSQQRMIAKPIKDKTGQIDVAEMSKLLQNGTGYKNAEHMIAAASNMSNNMKKKKPDGTDMSAEEAAMEASKVKWKDAWAAMAEYYTHNLITGVETYVVNMIGSPIAQAWQTLLVKPVAAGVGALKKTVGMDSYDRVTAEEIEANLAAGLIGLYDGLGAFTRELKGMSQQFGTGKTDNLEGHMARVLGAAGGKIGGDKGAAIGRGTGTAATAGFRLLGGTDAYWKTEIFRSELTGLAVRQARSKGIEVNQHINDVLMNPNKPEHRELVNEAMQRAKEYTFTDSDRPGAIGDIARGTKKFLAAHPWLKPLAPYVDTPSNLFHFVLENTTGPVTQKWRDEFAQGGAKQDMAIGKVVVGAGIWTAAWQLWEADILAGAADWKDQKLIETMEGETKALYIQGKYYTIDRLEPISMSVLGLVDTFERISRARDSTDVAIGFASIVTEIGEKAMDATFMMGISDFMKVLTEDKDFEKWAAGFASGFVPYSGTVRSVQKVVDTQPRLVTGDNFYNLVKNKLKSQIPWLSSDLPVNQYWDGSPKRPKGSKPAYQMTLMDKLFYTTSPVKVNEPDKGKKDLATEALLENGVDPRRPTHEISIGRGRGAVTINLMDLDDDNNHVYALYMAAVGQERRKAVEAVINSSGYIREESGYGSTNQGMLSKALTKGQQMGKYIFLKEILPDYAAANPDVMTKLGEITAMDFESMAERARAETLPKDMQEQVELKGKTSDALPLPPHLRKDENINGQVDF